MGYQLGVDLGTTYTAAATARDGRVQVVSLGNRAAQMPSVVFLRGDETVLVGEAAERRGTSEPVRLAREFKRRVGDPTPLVVGGTPYSAEALMAKLLEWVVATVAEQEGGLPDRVAVTHPANWGPYKQDLLAQAVRLAGLEDVTFLTEPEAAAHYYATNERVAIGAVVAVYDLGGGTFDATILRKTDQGFETLGQPEGIERLGGIDFDEAVYQHVDVATGRAASSLDATDPHSVSAAARLRQETVAAKEALSADTDTTVAVMLPTIQTEIRLTRPEFEAMIRLRLSDTVDALRRAMKSAGVAPQQIGRVLLVGGSSRIPLVAQMVTSELGRPVALDAHPKHSVACGAALAAAAAAGETATEVIPSPLPIAVPPPPPRPPVDESTELVPAPVPVVAAPAPAPAPAPVPAPASPQQPAPTPSPPQARTSPPTVPFAPGPASPGPASAGPDVEGPQIAYPGRASVPPVPPPHSSHPPPATPPTPDRAAPQLPSGSVPKERTTGVKVAWAIVVVALLVVAATAGYLAFGRSQPSPSSAESTAPDSTAAPPTTAAATTVPVGKPSVRITSVSKDDDTYTVDFSTAGFSMREGGGTGSMHVHFFFNTTKPANAGENGNPPGNWFLYSGSSPFVGAAAEIGGEKGDTGATAICAVVANHEHAVEDPNSGNCVPFQ